LAELERLRLVERRVALAQRKARWQLRLGRIAEATADLSALALEQPLNEPVAALLMHALHRGARRAEALAVFERTAGRLDGDLGVAPGDLLRRARWAVLRGDGVRDEVRDDVRDNMRDDAGNDTEHDARHARDQVHGRGHTHRHPHVHSREHVHSHEQVHSLEQVHGRGPGRAGAA
jgi:DNA-binding SARP family transcriptional activator